MRLTTLIVAFSPLVTAGCSTENSVPRIDAGMPIVLHLGLPSEKIPEAEITLPTKAAEGFRFLVAELGRAGRAHNAIPKESLGVFVVADHEFRWRGSILYYLSSSESGVEIASIQLGKMYSDLSEGRSESLEDLILPLEELAKPH